MTTKASKTHTRLFSLIPTVLLCIGAVGCSGGGSSGGGGIGGVAAAPITSSQAVGPLTGIEIQPATALTIDNGLNEGFQIAVDAKHTGADMDATRDATYVVENTGVAQISGDGYITPISEGTTKIAVTYGGFTAQVDVTIVAPSGVAPNLTALSIFPATRNMPAVDPSINLEQFQQLVVYATDDQGRLWDLTRTAPIGLYDMNNASTLAARVSNTGLLRAIIDDEVLAVSRVASAGLVFGAHFVLGAGPQATPIDVTSLYNGGALATSTNPLDVAVLDNLFGNLVEPSARADDGEFLRRLTADTIGRTPTEAELTTFESNNSPTKRADEVDRLMNMPAFAAKWAGHFNEYFEMLNDAGFTAWANTEIANGTSIAQMFSDLATGNVPSFEATHTNAAMKVDILLQTGTGMTAQCAVCHDHPLTGPADVLKWNQIERYGLDAFFAVNDSEATPLDKFGIRSGNNGNPVAPGFALDPTANVTSDGNTALATRRAEFATLFTSSSAFYRGMGHRIFAEVSGELLNTDQFLEKNVGAVLVPNVLDALSTIFATDSSLKGFLRAIFTSEFYQLSSEYADDLSDALLPRRTLRRHNAETVVGAVENVTGGTLAGGDLTFVQQVFGFPFDHDSISERNNAVNMSQAFLLMNSPAVQDLVSANGGTIANLATQVGGGGMTQTQAITQIFRSALSRTPNAAEIQCGLDAITGAPTVREGLEDVAAVLMSTTEFVMR